MNKKTLFIFLSIIVISLFLRLYKVDQAFFNLDQDRDAWEMRKMVEEKKPALIGPDIRRGRVKFFLGPYHYYFFTPSLIISKFDPIGPIVFASLFGVATTALIFFITKDLFNMRTAFMASSIHAGSFFLSEVDRMPWNPYHLFYLSLLFLYFLIKSTRGKPFLFPLGIGVFALLLQSHPTTIFLSPVLLYSLLNLFKKSNKEVVFILFLSAMVFFVLISPLIVFDLRHDFINSKLFFESLTTKSASAVNISEKLTILLKVIASINQEIVNVFTYGRSVETNTQGQWLVFIPLFLFFFSKIKTIDKEKTKTIIFFLLPWICYLVGFVLFTGDLNSLTLQGELQLYYFTPIIVGYVVFLSYTIDGYLKAGLSKPAVIVTLLGFMLLSTTWRLEYGNNYSYRNKKDAVNYITHDTNGKPFSLGVWDSHAFGYPDGLRYLFSLYTKDDLFNENNPEYRITIPPAKRPWIKEFGPIGVERPQDRI